MVTEKRPLTLDVFDYSGNLIINLYDSSKSMSGEAVDIHKVDERNGWKELYFTLPSVCEGENGEEENYRLQYLVADYKIRFVDENETDWFLISEPKISHSNYSKTVTVRAGHISQLLKTKKLTLEFSDSEGNNVGTARDFLECILEGTDWSVGNVTEFVEEDIVDDNGNHPIKYRSLQASAKTGAFKLIEDVCDLFEAKPTYHGDTMIVDITPMNPFSNETEEGKIPDMVINDQCGVLELHYARNVKDLQRVINAENIVTKLYGYGSYGDRNGLCSLQTATHEEYYYTLLQSYSSGTEMSFTDTFGATYYFVLERNILSGETLTWSRLDHASRSYIWDESYPNESGNSGHAYHLTQIPAGDISEVISLDDQEVSTLTFDLKVQNLFPFVLNLNYYDKIGLLTEEMFQSIAAYQRGMLELYNNSMQKATDFVNAANKVSKIGNTQTGFLRFACGGYSVNPDGTSTLYIDWTQEDHGVIYRSDYLNTRKDWFIWHVAKDLKPNGDPISGTPSYVLVAHKQEGDAPITWEKAYVKEIYMGKTNSEAIPVKGSDNNFGDFTYRLEDDDSFPTRLVLWAPWCTDGRTRSLPAYSSTDEFYLFCTNSQSGMLAGLEVQDESIINMHIKTATATESLSHPVYFMDGRPGRDTVPPTEVVSIDNQYGWYYKYYYLAPQYRIGDLYYCGPKDINWHPVTVGNNPKGSEVNGDYFYNTETKVLSCKVAGSWVLLDAASDQRITDYFSQVLFWCKYRDQLYKGIREKYYHLIDGEETGKSLNYLPAGRYLISSEYDFYWAFTTNMDIPANKSVYIDTQHQYVYQDDQITNIVQANVQPKDTMTFFTDSIISNDDFTVGWIDPNTGEDVPLDYFNKKFEGYKTGYIPVYPGETYNVDMPMPNHSGNSYTAFIMLYDGAKRVRGRSINVSPTSSVYPEGNRIRGSFVIPTKTTIDYQSTSYMPDVEYIKIAWSAPLHQVFSCGKISLDGYDNKVYLNDNSKTLYTLLTTTSTDGEMLSIVHLMNEFVNSANYCYLESLGALKEAQGLINQADANLSRTLGLTLREGYWQENSYVEGDEPKLYRDALKNINEISKPQIEYSVSFIDPYGANEHIMYSVDGVSDDVKYPDIQITDAVHLVDPSIDVNCWAYIDKVDKYYDKPWNTTIDINTRLSLIGQHDFTDVLSSIAEVAKLTKGQQSMYQAAAQASGVDLSGTNYNNSMYEGVNYSGAMQIYNAPVIVINGTSFEAELIEREEIAPIILEGSGISGKIVLGTDLTGPLSKGWSVSTAVEERVRKEIEDAMVRNNLRFQNSVSVWYVDPDTGGIIFETADGTSALMISGAGFAGATQKDENGDWRFTTFATGDGVLAESIKGHKLKADVLEVGSITADKLSSEAGKNLDISSNKGLDIYATTDGTKPTGALRTTDAMIEIHAGDPYGETQEDKFGQINVLAGGSLNLKAGRVIDYYNTMSQFPSYPVKTAEQTKEQYNAYAQDWCARVRYDKEFDIGYEWDGDADPLGPYLEAKKETPEYQEATEQEKRELLIEWEYEWNQINSQGTWKVAEINGTINIEAGRELNLTSGSKINISAGSDAFADAEINIGTKGSINIESNGQLKLQSGYPVVTYRAVQAAADGSPAFAGQKYTTYVNLGDVDAQGAIIDEDYRYAYTIWEFDGTQYHESQTANIKIGATGLLEVGSAGKMKIISDGSMLIEAGGKLDMIAGSRMRIGVGAEGVDNDAKLEVLSTGQILVNGGKIDVFAINNGETSEINIGSDGKLNIDSTGSMCIGMKAGENPVKRFVDTLPDSPPAGQQNDIFYDDSQDSLFKWSNGDWVSVGTTELPNLMIGSTGILEIGSYGILKLGAGRTASDNARLIIESTSKIKLKSGSSMDIYAGGDLNIGTFNPQGTNARANINIGSAGDINILSNGEINIGSEGKMNVYAHGTLTIGAGSVISTYSTVASIPIPPPNPYALYITNDEPIIKEWLWDPVRSAFVNAKDSNFAPKIEIGSAGTLEINSRGNITINSGGTFTVSSNKFKIDSSGNVELEGVITATAGGSIGGWSIAATELKSSDGKTGMSSTTTGANVVFWAGDAVKTNSDFYVTAQGKLYAKNINVEGYVNASSGKIGDWIIQDGEIKSKYYDVGLAAPISGTHGEYCIWAGRPDKATAPFRVDSLGSTWIKDLNVTEGNITAGNWRLDNNGLLWNDDNVSTGDITRISLFELPGSGSTFGSFNIYTELKGTPGGCGLSFGINTITPFPEYNPPNYRIYLGTGTNPFAGMCAVSYSQPSSVYIKHSINDIQNAGEKIDTLHPVTFVYNGDKNERKRFGLIYEDAVEKLPEICTCDDNNKAIDYTELVPILLKEIQNLRQRVKVLEGDKQ